MATTLQADTQRQFSAVAARLTDEGTVDLGGSSHAFRRLFRIADTSFYALTSIDDSARAAVGQTTRALMFIAIGALGLALLGSIWLAHRLSKPIGRLSASLHTMATSRQFDKRLRADRIQRGARRPDRDVQRADGIGRGGGSGNRSRVYRGHSCAGRGARRARPVHRRSLGARERRIGGDRPRVEAGRRRSRGAQARRPAPRHRQDRRARRGADEAGTADRQRVRHDQAAHGARRDGSCAPSRSCRGMSQSSSSITSGRTAAATRTACRGPRFRWRRTSFTWPTRSTR